MCTVCTVCTMVVGRHSVCMEPTELVWLKRNRINAPAESQTSLPKSRILTTVCAT